MLVMSYPMDTDNHFRLANIVGALKVHSLDSWPKAQKVFVMCREPREIIGELKGYSMCDQGETFAYE